MSLWSTKKGRAVLRRAPSRQKEVIRTFLVGCRTVFKNPLPRNREPSCSEVSVLRLSWSLCGPKVCAKSDQQDAVGEIEVTSKHHRHKEMMMNMRDVMLQVLSF